MDGIVYRTWTNRREELAEHVARIRNDESRGLLPQQPEEDEDEVEVPEGRLRYRQHRVRERSPKLRRKKIEEVFRRGGAVACEICDFDFAHTYGVRGEGFIECHHIRPLSDAGASTTRLRDLALVCSNCHRMIHRRSPWPTPRELAVSIQNSP